MNPISRTRREPTATIAAVFFVAAAFLPAARAAGPIDPVVAAAEGIFPELPNFHKVDDHLYRGGQPGVGGFARLKSHGVRTVINLRHEDALVKSEEAEARAAGLRYFSVPMHGLARPTEKQITSVLEIIDDPSNWPVFVHCKRGADRTGVIVACHRLSCAKWKPEQAIREAMGHGMMKLEIAKRSYIRGFYGRLSTTQVAAVAPAEASRTLDSPLSTSEASAGR